MIQVGGHVSTDQSMTNEEIYKLFPNFDEIESDLWEVFYGDKESDDNYISLVDREYSDAINSRGWLSVFLNNIEYVAVVRDGNIDGSIIEQFGPNAEYKTSPKYSYSFQLDPAWLRGLTKTGQRLAKMKYKNLSTEIQKVCNDYIYDRYFSPTEKIRNHYHEYMNKFHLILVSKLID
jgi:hypothetical protein